MIIRVVPRIQTVIRPFGDKITVFLMRRNIMSKFTSEMVDDYADKLLIGLTK